MMCIGDDYLFAPRKLLVYLLSILLCECLSVNNKSAEPIKFGKYGV